MSEYYAYKGLRKMADRHAKAGEYQKARDCYLRALELSPFQPDEVLIKKINSLASKANAQNQPAAGRKPSIKTSPNTSKKTSTDKFSNHGEHKAIIRKQPQLNIESTFLPHRFFAKLSTSQIIPDEACRPLSESIWANIRKEEADFDKMVELSAGKNVPCEFLWTPITCEDEKFIDLAKAEHASWMHCVIEKVEAEYYAPFVGAGSFMPVDLGQKNQSVQYVLTVVVCGSEHLKSSAKGNSSQEAMKRWWHFWK